MAMGTNKPAKAASNAVKKGTKTARKY